MLKESKSFILRIEFDSTSGDRPYGELRECIEETVKSLGHTPVSFKFAGSPDPYLFEDPDDLPEDLL